MKMPSRDFKTHGPLVPRASIFRYVCESITAIAEEIMENKLFTALQNIFLMKNDKT